MKKMVKYTDDNGVTRKTKVYKETPDGVEVNENYNTVLIPWKQVEEIYEEEEPKPKTEKYTPPYSYDGPCKECNGHGKIMGCSRCGKGVIDKYF